ncbi:MAG: FG-GAP repeat protein, partial [Planctomycetales bacterium]|nr:FG-GAP repeat protein [Planctomycetales bacterium]
LVAGASFAGDGSADDVNTIYGDLANGDAIPTISGSHRDQIYGDAGRNVVVAGAGDDVVRTFGGNDEIRGGAGDDDIQSGSGSDFVAGGWGRDTIVAGASIDGNGDSNDRNIVYGDRDDNNPAPLPLTDHGDTIYTDAGNDIVDAGAGDDYIKTFAGSDSIVGGWGADTIFASVNENGGGSATDINTVYGDLIDSKNAPGNQRDHSDLIYTDHGNDVIDSGRGDDIVYALGGSDTVIGGWGADTIYAGVTKKRGGSAQDTHLIYADQGPADTSSMPGNSEDHNDIVYVDDGDDVVYAGVGSDEVWTFAGNDLIYAGAGNDFINSGLDDDIVYGEAGDDRIITESGFDVVWGSTGNDSIDAGDDDDFVVGGTGNDRIDGGNGRDVLWGGTNVIAINEFRRDDPTFFAEPMGFISAEIAYPTGYVPLNTMPIVLLGLSVEGEYGDGNDELFGGRDQDWLFGGGDADILDGGDEVEYFNGTFLAGDYLDGGSGNDLIRGGQGNDFIRGGSNNDMLLGGSGIDQLYGESGADSLFGDAGVVVAGDHQLAGQRLWGGDGIDYLWAFAPTLDAFAEAQLRGDELHGGPGGDWIYGNLRREVLIGDSGSDSIFGDYLRGPAYATNHQAAIVGADDLLLGGSGEDKLYGGGGSDTIWGGRDSDWLEGQNGSDQLYGGSGIDMMVMDVSPAYTEPGDRFDGHFGNAVANDTPDDNATDILLIEGTQYNDTIRLKEDNSAGPGALLVDYVSIDPLNSSHNITIPGLTASWRDSQGTPLVEQFRISGLLGDDWIEFATGDDAIDLSSLIERSNDWVGVIDGGPGNDTLQGSAGRDRLDGGSGSDVLFGLAGNDQLLAGQGFSIDNDQLFAGQGHDDLIGGQGSNQLFAWSMNPATGETFGVFVDPAGNLHEDTQKDLQLESWLSAEEDIRDVSKVNGLSIDQPNHVDRLRFNLPATGTANDSISLTPADSTGSLRFEIYQGTNLLNGLTSTDGAPVTLDLESYAVGEYELRIFRPAESVQAFQSQPYQLEFAIGTAGDRELDLTYRPEDTGQNRILGGPKADDLYGGTGLDFLYGNGAPVDDPDRLYNRYGQRFESLDNADAGEEWKQYAKSTGSVWYYGGTNRDDIITVDFVTEPGVLQGHHLITRLTNNSGNFTFDAQVQLDFEATDENGNLVWDPTDALPGLNLVSLAPSDTEGRLSATAEFTLTVDGGEPIDVSVISNSHNEVLDDLIDDINTALQQAFFTAGADVLVEARRVGDRIRLVRLEGDGITPLIRPRAMELSNAVGLIPAELKSVDTDLLLLGEVQPSDYATMDVRFDLSIDSGNPTSIVIAANPTNTTLDQLLADINAAIQLGFEAAGRRQIITAIAEGSDIYLVRHDDTPLEESLVLTNANPITTTELHFSEAQIAIRGQLRNLLPPEGDFTAILIDALGGNDQITVGPTVVKSVWVDAGDGDDRVEVLSGRPILADLTDGGVGSVNIRNDSRATAYDLTPSPSMIVGHQLFTGLTIDNPMDVDWYRFKLDSPPRPGSALIVSSLASDDRISLALYQSTDEPECPTYLTGFSGADRIELASLNFAANEEYWIQITSDRTPTVYEIEFFQPDAAEGDLGNDQRTTAYELLASGTLDQDIARFGLLSGLSIHANDEDWFKFKLADDAGPDDWIEISTLTDEPVRLEIVDQQGIVASVNGQSLTTRTAPQRTRRLYLDGLTRDTFYYLHVNAAGPTRYELKPSIGLNPGTEVLEFSELSATDLSSEQHILRRDVLLGGPGNDIISGGSWEEWIFGGPGNDVLTGGYDRQASDLIWGGDGDDTFQIITDQLPLISRQSRSITTANQQTFIPTYSDFYDGQAGNDRVLFLGGDIDRNGVPVPDHVAVNYNGNLHRYEVTSRVWNYEEQHFVTDPLSGLPRQDFAYFTSNSVESFQIDTQAGDDEVHADPEYLVNGDQWGFESSDRPQRGSLIDLVIHGGEGNDRLFGGAGNDQIFGGSGLDVIRGGGGNDSIDGGDGGDWIAGGRSETVPDIFEIPVGIVSGFATNDVPGSATLIDVPFERLLQQQSPFIDQLNFHLNDREDWYAIKAPAAFDSGTVKSFSDSSSAQLVREMLDIQFYREDGLEDDAAQTIFESVSYNERIQLFPAVDTDAGEGVTISIVPKLAGVPEYYLIRVLNPETVLSPNQDSVVPFGHHYRLQFNANKDAGPVVGESIDVDTTSAAISISPSYAGDRAVVIPLGDINGDGFDDFIGHVLETADSSIARLYFGGEFESGYLPTSVSIKLPAPVFSSSTLDPRSLFANGDFNADGRSDLMVGTTGVTGGDGNTVAILLGRDDAFDLVASSRDFDLSGLVDPQFRLRIDGTEFSGSGGTSIRLRSDAAADLEGLIAEFNLQLSAAGLNSRVTAIAPHSIVKSIDGNALQTTIPSGIGTGDSFIFGDPNLPQTYFVIVDTPTTIRLASTYQDAVDGHSVPIPAQLVGQVIQWNQLRLRLLQGSKIELMMTNPETNALRTALGFVEGQRNAWHSPIDLSGLPDDFTTLSDNDSEGHGRFDTPRPNVPVHADIQINQLGNERLTLANAGDLNGDGTDDIVIGLPDADSTGLNSGSTLLIDGNTDWRSANRLLEADFAAAVTNAFGFYENFSEGFSSHTSSGLPTQWHMPSIVEPLSGAIETETFFRLSDPSSTQDDYDTGRVVSSLTSNWIDLSGVPQSQDIALSFRYTLQTEHVAPAYDNARAMVSFESELDIQSTIQLNASTLGTGDAVEYKAGTGGSSMGGLSSGHIYYVVKLDDARIRLAASHDDALQGEWIWISDHGTGANHSITRTSDSQVQSFDPFVSVSTVLLIASNDSNTNAQVLLDPNPNWSSIEVRDLTTRRERMQIRFDFDTVDSVANDFPGWQIDDVVVRAQPAELSGQSARVVINGENSGDHFGIAVGGVADFNGLIGSVDSVSDLVVISDSRGAIANAAAYVFYGENGLLTGSASMADVVIPLSIDLPTGLVNLGNAFPESSSLNPDGTDPLPRSDFAVSSAGAVDLVIGAASGTIPSVLTLPNLNHLLGLGDVDGDGFDDLGYVAAESSFDLVSSGGLLFHNVGHVVSSRGLFGLNDTEIADKIANSPDLVVETGRPLFSHAAVGTPFSFGSLGNINGDAFADFAIADSITGNQLHLFAGQRVFSSPVYVATETNLFDDLYRFQVALPWLNNQESGTSIQVVSNESSPLSTAFPLASITAGETLAGSVSVGDVNGDRFDDVIVFGTDTAWLLFGPVSLSRGANVTDHASVQFALAGLGGPQRSRGDFNGDGIDDLIFVDADGKERFIFGRGLKGDEQHKQWLASYTAADVDKTLADHQKVSQTSFINGTTQLAWPNADLNTSTQPQFGKDIAVIGDLDGNGVPDLLVGATGTDTGTSSLNRGVVYLLWMDWDGSVLGSKKLSDEFGSTVMGNSTDYFGYSIAPLGDLDGDGTIEVAIGQFGTTEVVRILSIDQAGDVSRSVDLLSPGSANIQFGHSVAAIGDINDDGVTDLAVGSPDSQINGSKLGAIWIYFLNEDGTAQGPPIQISESLGGFTGDLDVDDSFGLDMTL